MKEREKERMKERKKEGKRYYLLWATCTKN
jgi:hypothetical protein